jgi:hypothetical protein
VRVRCVTARPLLLNLAEGRGGPANAPGIRHVTFAVEDIDAVVAGLRARGTELVGKLERYEDRYRLCYVRGPGGSSSSWQSRSADKPAPRALRPACV